MKTLVVNALVCCAVLLPFHADAKPKTYGGFAPGKTFTFKVKTRVTSKSVGQKITKGVAVPAGVPNLKLGQSVVFRIGAKGQLTSTGKFTIPFKANGGTSNVYNQLIAGLNSKVNTATVFKGLANKPTGVALTFVRNTYAGYKTTTTQVNYTLK